MTAIGCGGCGAAVLRARYPVARDYITEDGFAVWACPDCGSARTLPVPADLGPYYPSRYRQYNPMIAAILRLLYQRRVAGWARQLAVPGSAFEMGCGNGLMLATLRDLGWQVSGSERTDDAARSARAQSGVRVVIGGPDDLAADETFDLLLMIQVLEHLEAPDEAVAAMARRLKPDGRLIIGVPNFASWQSRFGGATWFHLDVPRHLQHFSLAGLTALLGRHGLAVERASYISPEHDPYGWIQSALNRVDRVPNRLTRLLMGLDRPNAVNVAHVVAACLLGFVAVPLAVVSWAVGEGALIEVICRKQEGILS
jgi:SAM-dependent methyltransferase